MPDESQPDPDPPLVRRVESPTDGIPLVSLVSPSVLKKPRPGFLEAILWCLIFVAVQTLVAILGIVVALGVSALQSSNARQFMSDLLDDIRVADSNDIHLPAAFCQAIAWGILIAQLASVGLIAIVLPWRIGRDWKRQIGVRIPSAIHVLLVVMITPAFIILAGGIELIVRRAIGLPTSQIEQSVGAAFAEFPWLLTFVAVGLGPGVVEEFWCRGFIGRGLCARYGLPIGIAATSVLFAAMHGNPTYLLVVPFLGAALHLIYLAGRSIWLSVTLHTLNNGLAVFLVVGGVPDWIDPAARGREMIVYLAAIALAIFASLSFWTSRTRLELVDRASVVGGSSKKWHPEYPGISAPPPGSGYRLTHGRIHPAAGIATLVAFVALIVLLAI